MEALIIGGGCIIGYMLNKEGRQATKVKSNSVLSPNNIPNAPIVYEQNRFKDVDMYMRSLAAQKHADKIKQTFPYDYRKPISVFPNDGNDGTPVNLVEFSGNSSVYQSSSQKRFNDNVTLAKSFNTNITAYDPASGQPISSVESFVDEKPMFRSNQFKDTNRETFQSVYNGPISPLTGLPLEMTHANMNPMFGGSIKQAGTGNENSQVLLELYTGTSSTDNQGTYRQKREVINPLPNNPQNPFQPNIYQVRDLQGRVEAGVKPSHEFESPVKAFRDLPIKTTTQVMPLNIDQQRGVLNKQVTYEGVMIPGQKGSTRPMDVNLRDNRWDMTSETKMGDFVSNRSILQGSTQNIVPVVRELNSTQVPQLNYTAPPNSSKKITNLSSQYAAQQSTYDNNAQIQKEVFTPGFGTAKYAIGRGVNTGVIVMTDPDKEFDNTYDMQPHQSIGPRMRNVDQPDYTLRDMTSKNDVGAINPNSSTKDNRAWKDANINVDATMKDIYGENSYLGLPHRDKGNGNRKTKFEEWTTNKEMNQFSNTGNPNSQIPAHMSYESVFNVDTSKEKDNVWIGTAKGVTNKQVSDGGQYINDKQELLVQDYMTNPTGKSQGINRDKYIDGLENNYQQLEYGGHYNGGKYGIGEDAKRSCQVQVKEDTTVAGRTNVGLARDNPKDGQMEFEMVLKPEQNKVTRTVFNKTQPNKNLQDKGVFVTRVTNNEALNPRLDGGLRITSDLYPWLKKEKIEDDHD